MNDGYLSFDDALAMSVVEEGHLRTTIAPGWDVRGNPHGGYLLALAAKAMATVVVQPDPISISASYLSPPAQGPADLLVEVLRSGKRQSTADVRLIQDGGILLQATATFGSLPSEAPRLLTNDVAPPASLPPPDACLGRAPKRFSPRLPMF